MGNNTEASGDKSTAMGWATTASGENSFAVGYQVKAIRDNSVAFGKYNQSGSNFIFSIGNGTSYSNKQNIVDILSNTNSTYFRCDIAPYSTLGGFSLGKATEKWSEVWSVNGTIQTSDTTLKKNIIPLAYGLKDLMKIKTISYQWKNDKYGVKKIGFNAQNLQQIIPEVIVNRDKVYDEKTRTYSYEKTDKLGVFYSDLIPVLTKSIQEQQAQIKEDKNKILNLEKPLKEMQKQIKILLEK